MLVLTRHLDESIVIGDHDCLIQVTVVEIRGNRVKLGIQAPEEIPVHRSEIFKRIVNSESSRLTGATV
jgi:carbon storage regulator